MRLTSPVFWYGTSSCTHTHTHSNEGFTGDKGDMPPHPGLRLVSSSIRDHRRKSGTAKDCLGVRGPAGGSPHTPLYPRELLATVPQRMPSLGV